MGVRELFELKGKVALVTGGSRGLGLQIAQALGEMGARIAIRRAQACRTQRSQVAAWETGYRCSDRGQRSDQAGSSAGAGGGGCRSLRRDQHPGQQRGARAGGAPAEQYPLDAWNKVMTLNSTSVFMLSQEVANRCFIPQHSGNIIVVASVAALRVGMTMKAAALLRIEGGGLASERASSLRSGGRTAFESTRFARDSSHRRCPSGLLEKISASVIERTPLGRIGGDTDLMGAAVYLASDASRHVTGQYIAVDGGASSV